MEKNRYADYSNPRVIEAIAIALNMTPHEVRRVATILGFLPTDTRREGSGYWTRYGKVQAAAAGGRAIRFAYLDAQGKASTRHAIPLGGVLTGQEGQHYVKTIDLGKDGPRSFRIDRMLDVQDAGVA